MTRPVTVAICGAGDRGLDTYARLIHERPDLGRVVAVAEPREDRRAEAGRRLGLPHDALFRDWRDLPPTADAVVVATQDPDHAAPAETFLARGQHLLLEKPIATTEADCRRIAEAARRSGRIFAVGHVLRYTGYFQKMRALVPEVGQVATVRHLEAVNFWHQAHSYVRGNWRREDLASPMIVAKSCHDMDLLLFLLGRRCLRLSSFGSLRHFRPENRPVGAALRCLDCEVPCPYDAARWYLGFVDRGHRGWPVSVLDVQPTREAVTRALREGPYGRCVYACDNDVVDHQVVAMAFDEGVSATFTMTAFTEGRGRETEILGSHGQLRGDQRRLELTRFRTGEVETWEFPDEDGHGGGDRGLTEAFLTAVRRGDPAILGCTPEDALHAHLLAFAAERARREGRVLDL